MVFSDEPTLVLLFYFYLLFRPQAILHRGIGIQGAGRLMQGIRGVSGACNPVGYAIRWIDRGSCRHGMRAESGGQGVDHPRSDADVRIHSFQHHERSSEVEKRSLNPLQAESGGPCPIRKLRMNYQQVGTEQHLHACRQSRIQISRTYYSIICCDATTWVLQGGVN